jgi:putative ABC transport system permease protein
VGADYYSLREQNRVFEDVAAYDTLTLNWNGIEKPLQVDAAQVTPSFFRVMSSQPMMGRYLAAQEQGVKAPAVVVLSYAFWRSRMASDAHVIGKTIMLDRMANTIIGVMPQGFDYPAGTQIWRPLPHGRSRAETAIRGAADEDGEHAGAAETRAGPPRAGDRTSRLAHIIRAEYPKDFETAGFLAGMAITVQPLQERLTGDVRPALLVFSGAVGLVLLIACVNVANLLLARASARQREIAVRLALGSDRARIIRQMLTESALLALPGGLVGVAMAYLAVSGLNGWKPLVLERYPAISMDFPTLAFTLGLTLATGLLFGMAPAVTAARVGIHEALESGGHVQSGGRSVTRLRQLLVVAELGVSLVLLIGAGLLAKSFLRLASADLGFPAPNLLTMRVNLVGRENGGGPAASLYPTAESQLRFYEDVLARVNGLPMVLAAAVSTDVPLSTEGFYSEGSFAVAGRAPVARAQRPHADVTMVSRDFFRTLKIPVHRGRAFDAQDNHGSTDKIVVNEALARKIFAGENPLGQRIVAGENDVRAGENHIQGWTIIGVAGNVRGRELGAEPAPLIYRCVCQSPTPFLSRMALMVRTARDPHAHSRGGRTGVCRGPQSAGF